MQPIIHLPTLPLQCQIDPYTPSILDAHAQIYSSIRANATLDDIEKMEAFEKVLNHSPYQHVFERLLRVDPLLFLSLFVWMEGKEKKEALIKWCYESLGNRAVEIFHQCFTSALQTKYPREIKSSLISTLLSSLPIEIEVKVADQFFKTSLAQSANFIFNILNEEKFKEWLTDYLQYFQQIDLLGNAIREIIDLSLPITTKRNSHISTLLKHSTETTRIDDWLMAHIDETNELGQLQILLHIDDREKNRYLWHLYQKHSTDSLVELLSKLIYWDEDLDRRVEWTQKMVNNFDGAYFQELCQTLVDKDLEDEEDNDPILYLLYALDNAKIDEFMNLSVELKESLLYRAMPYKKGSYQQLITHVSTENINKFLYKCELPIASQNPIDSTLGIFGNWTTFDEIMGYIDNAIKDNALADFMQTFSGDLYRIPPFLIAVAMHHPSFQTTLVQASLYLKSSQLKALGLGLTESTLFSTLEMLTEVPISMDQYKSLIKVIQGPLLEKYIRQEYAVIGRKCEEIHSIFDQIKHSLTDLDNGDLSNLDHMIDRASQLHFQIVKILSPFHRMLVELSKEISPILSIPFQKLWDGCREKLHCLNDENNGYRKRLLDFKPPKVQEEETYLWKSDVSLILSSQFKGIEYFEGVGFRTDRDFNIIGINFEREGFETILKSYLGQSEKLLKIWKKFKKRHITSLSDLETFGLIDDYKDFFSLEAIAAKMGIELWNQ